MLCKGRDSLIGGYCMWKESVFSDGSREFLSNPYPKLKEWVEVSICVEYGAPIDAILLRRKMNGLEHVEEMVKSHVKNGLQYYKCRIEVQEPVVNYHFYLVSEGKIFYYNQKGLCEYCFDEVFDFRILADYEPCEWVANNVFYQIFVDRFCNGKNEISVKDQEYCFGEYPTQRIFDWNREPEEYAQAHCVDFYGGDLYGVQKKLLYLKELGVDAIYLTPIFSAQSVHRYDCMDYFHVDEHLGGNEALQELCESIHQEAMHLVLDISINHTGTAYSWFQENKEFYYFEDDGSYGTYYGVSSLAKLNYSSEELRKIIYKEKDSVLRRWLQEPYQIDGWRFDVAPTVGEYGTDHFGEELWREIRTAIKDEKENAYILAEDWNESYEHLKGDAWDGIMNFVGCGRPIREYVGQLDFRMKKEPLRNLLPNTSAEAFYNRIMQFYGKLPHALWGNQFNMIDCHDIARLHNDENISFAQYKIAVCLQYMLPGCVCMYYGDEVGIKGRLGSAEGCRYPMEWEHNLEENRYYQLYSKMNQMKHQFQCLREGSFRFLYVKDRCLALVRMCGDEGILLVTSMEDKPMELTLSLEELGTQFVLPEKTIFGEKLSYMKEETQYVLHIPEKTGYLIDISNRI